MLLSHGIDLAECSWLSPSGDGCSDQSTEDAQSTGLFKGCLDSLGRSLLRLLPGAAAENWGVTQKSARQESVKPGSSTLQDNRCTPVVAALQRTEQEDDTFEVVLAYTASSRPALAAQHPGSEQQQQKEM